MSTTIYGVVYSCYDEYSVYGLYTQREMAEHHMSLLDKDDKRWCDVEEFDLDDVMPVKWSWFHAMTSIDSEHIHVRETSTVSSSPGVEEQTIQNQRSITVMANTRKRAMEMMAEAQNKGKKGKKK